MATVEQLMDEAERKSQQPKPDPFEQDARRQIRSYQKESDEEREKRQEKNRQESPDTGKISSIIYPKSKTHTIGLRDKMMMSSIGRQIRFDLARGPAVKGKLVEVDLELGQCTVQGPERSPPSLIFIQFRHIVRLEIYPD